MNTTGRTVEHALVEAMKRSERFVFSVAFVTSSGLAQLKQHLLDFRGSGQIITSDFLGFNRPEVFEELLKLRELRGIEVFRYRSRGFHPKGSRVLETRIRDCDGRKLESHQPGNFQKL